MGRKNLLAGVDPFGGKSEGEPPKDRPSLSMTDADAALFGDITKLDAGRQTVRPIPIIEIYPDVKQARRAVPSAVREHWNGEPRTVPEMFNFWLDLIDTERERAQAAKFNLSDYLWAEAAEKRARSEEEVEADGYRPGPAESAFLKVVDLAVSIRRDGLTNPVTVEQRGARRFHLETGERRWLAYHMLFNFFNAGTGAPDEHAKWEKIPAIVVSQLSVWRQASENTARADLNAIGRARQFSILLMDLLQRDGMTFKPYEQMVQTGQCDRLYYAQVLEHRVPSGKGETLSNAIGAGHRSAFTRCRMLLGLPDTVWDIGDNLDVSEDELLRWAKLPQADAIEQARLYSEKIVASRNNLATQPTQPTDQKKTEKSPALLADPALKRGKRFFSPQDDAIFREILAIRDGVGQAEPATKHQVKTLLDQAQARITALKQLLDNA